MRRFLLCVFILLPMWAWAIDNQPVTPLPNTTPNSSSYSVTRTYLKDELPAILGRYFPQGWVYSGGIHGTEASCTSDAFAVEAFTPQGERVLATSDLAGVSAAIDYDAAGCNCDNPGSDTAWVIASASSSSTLGNFQRVSGTNYFVNCTDATPTLPTDSTWLLKTTITNGAIAAVADYRNFDPTARERINVEYWGASTTASAADNATAIQTALNYASNTGATVVIPALYPITTLSVPNGVRAILGPGGFQATGQFGAQGAVLELASDVNTLNIEGLRFVMSTSGTGAKYGIYGVCSSCLIAHNIMTNFEDINGHNGIYMAAGSANTRIIGNQITLVQPPLTVGHTAQGIAMVGTADAFSGYFTGSGTCTSPSVPITQMTVSGNVIFGGTHGIWGRALQFSAITGNSIRYSWHRNMELEFSSNHNTVSGNSLTEFYSSALNLSYCSSFNDVSGNTAFSTVANGQAPFLAYVGTTDNLFANNRIAVSGTATVFGVYLAINSSRNTVEGNDITGIRWAGVSVQSDWVDPLPSGADYSLPVDAAASPTGQWAYGGSQDNVIQDNIIRAPTGSDAVAISLAAIGTVGGVSGTVIKGNHVVSTAFDYQLHIFEENSSDPVTTTWLVDNTWNTGLFSLGSRGQGHFQTIHNNYALDYGVVYAFANGDATPDVTVGADFVTANSAGTQITFFDGNVLDNREFTLRMDVNTGITHDNTKIRLLGGANIAQGAVDSNFFIHFRNLGGGTAGIWVEMWRRN